MRHRRMNRCIALVLCGVISLTGCKGGNQNVQETSYYKLTIDGDKKYYTESDENVQKLVSVTDAFMADYANLDYRQPELVKKELDYYTESTRTFHEETGKMDRKIASLVSSQLEQSVTEIGVHEIQFYGFEGKKRAKVMCDYIVLLANATQDYLDGNGLKLNTSYKRTITIDFELEHDEWKIEEYSVSAHEEV